jgi:isopropylmalate/citramalate/homocitrate synthase-like protein
MIYDTTLRDGEQSPGVCFSPDQKLEIAKKLEEVGISQFEAGFPVICQEEMRAVKKITEENLGALVLTLARTMEKDIDACIDSGSDGIITFIATSDIHLKYKLRINREDVIQKVVKAVEYSKAHFEFVQLACEDATRTELSFLTTVCKIAEEAGADRVSLADTVGMASPEKMTNLVREVKNKVKIPIAVHCHNDFGLALANSLAAINAGAKAVSCTVNGIGERAGNTPLEELVMALKYLYGIDLKLKTEKFKELSELVSKYSKVPVPLSKPIVGENAFKHESGIHVSGVLENPSTYEPFDPAEVGQKRKISLGKHSGLKALKYKLDKMGLKIPEERQKEILDIIKRCK